MHRTATCFINVNIVRGSIWISIFGLVSTRSPYYPIYVPVCAALKLVVGNKYYNKSETNQININIDQFINVYIMHQWLKYKI